MYAHYEHELTILPSVCDREMKLSIADTFAIFMDIASYHAFLLGVGADRMFPRGLFWLTTKTKVRFYRRPAMMERITVATTPLAPEKIRSVREYQILQDGKLLIEGKTEWAVLELESGKIHPMADVFAPELELCTQAGFPEPFVRIPPDFSGAEELGRYTVRSTDIDLGKHMNNVAYLRAVLGLLPSAELDAMPAGEVEIAFRTPCFEGEGFTVLRRKEADHWDLAALREDGKPAVLLRVSGAANAAL